MTDPTPHDLTALVLDKITALGDGPAAVYFGVSPATISAWKSRKNLPSLAAAQKAWDDCRACMSPELWGRGNETLAMGVPIYETLEPSFFISIIGAMKRYGMDKIILIPRTRTLIDEARNDIVARFLETKAEYLLFTDVDMIIPNGNGQLMRKLGLTTPEPKASINAIDRIMSHPKEHGIIGGLYIDRRGGNKIQCEHGWRSPADNNRLLGLFTGATKEEGLEETGWVGMGFVRIARWVFEKMRDEAKKPGSPLADILPPPGRENEPLGYFGRTSKWRGEDIAFCRRAQLCGIKTYVDKSILCGHIGRRVF